MVGGSTGVLMPRGRVQKRRAAQGPAAWRPLALPLVAAWGLCQHASHTVSQGLPCMHSSSAPVGVVRARVGVGRAAVGVGGAVRLGRAQAGVMLMNQTIALPNAPPRLAASQPLTPPAACHSLAVPPHLTHPAASHSQGSSPQTPLLTSPPNFRACAKGLRESKYIHHQHQCQTLQLRQHPGAHLVALLGLGVQGGSGRRKRNGKQGRRQRG